MDLIPGELQDRIKYLAGESMFLAADAWGVTEIMGKSLEGHGGQDDGDDEVAPWSNVGIGVHPTKHENEPTVVANPEDEDNLVAGSHFFGPPAPFENRCVAYFSNDGGATWSAPVAMPQLTPDSFCSDPVLAFAPDGSRVYYAYMNIRFTFAFVFPFLTQSEDFDILVSYSDDGGATWTGPVVALDGDPFSITFDVTTGEIIDLDPGFDYDKPWVGTHVPVDDDQENSNWVYVTATRFDIFSPDFDCHIAFTRSSDMAVSWSTPDLLDSSVGGCGFPVVQGSRPAGGLGGDVLVAWYNSGPDGWLAGSFDIKTRYSTDNGATWGATVAAVTDTFETPFWLGPFAFYHRWWATMMPDVEIAPDGSAHIVYAHDPEENGLFFDGFFIPNISTTSEDGDIRYIGSAAAPYSSWSDPVTLNDDGLVRAQGYPALETSQGDDDDLELHVIWEDHRIFPETPAIFPASSNLLFDMFYTGMGADDEDDEDSGGWSANRRITDMFSINDFIFIGDYNDITTSDDLVFGVWTDRRHQPSIFDGEDNVFGARIDDGGDNDVEDDDVEDVFVGQWFSVDIDGSNQDLHIGLGDHGVYTIAYFDDATGCGFPAVAYGGALADGNDLAVSMDAWCLEDPPYLWLHAEFTLTYDPNTDTLGSEFGTWTRVAVDDEEDEEDDDVEDVFVGQWFSVDIDGSNQDLQIGLGDHGVYTLTYFDDRTFCGPSAVGYGGALADGNELAVAMDFWCLDTPPYFWFHAEFTLTYDPDTDTLVWENGVWTRVTDDDDEDDGEALRLNILANCEIDFSVFPFTGVGEIEFPEDEDFFVEHGWGFEPWSTENQAAALSDATRFDLFVDGEQVESTETVTIDTVADTMIKLFRTDFDDDAEDTHVFTGMWSRSANFADLGGGDLEDAVLILTCDVTVHFVEFDDEEDDDRDDELLPLEWHRLNPVRFPTPEHEVLTCTVEAHDWVCRYDKIPEPDLGFEDPPEGTFGNFFGRELPREGPGAFECLIGFPFDCDDVTLVVEGIMAFYPPFFAFTVRQQLIFTEDDVLYVYWTSPFNFVCPWYPTFDEALDANPFPKPFNGVDFPAQDCVFGVG